MRLVFSDTVFHTCLAARDLNDHLVRSGTVLAEERGAFLTRNRLRQTCPRRMEMNREWLMLLVPRSPLQYSIPQLGYRRRGTITAPSTRKSAEMRTGGLLLSDHHHAGLVSLCLEERQVLCDEVGVCQWKHSSQHLDGCGPVYSKRPGSPQHRAQRRRRRPQSRTEALGRDARLGASRLQEQAATIAPIQAHVMDRSISALVGSGDSGKGRRVHTFSPREKVLHHLNLVNPYYEGSSKDGSTPIPFAETEALQPWQGSSAMTFL